MQGSSHITSLIIKPTAARVELSHIGDRNPYLVLIAKEKVFKGIPDKKKGPTPVFEDEFELMKPFPDTVYLELWNMDSKGSESVLGYGALSIGESQRTATVTFIHSREKVGEIDFVLTPRGVRDDDIGKRLAGLIGTNQFDRGETLKESQPRELTRAGSALIQSNVASDWIKGPDTPDLNPAYEIGMADSLPYDRTNSRSLLNPDKADQTPNSVGGRIGADQQGSSYGRQEQPKSFSQHEFDNRQSHNRPDARRNTAMPAPGYYGPGQQQWQPPPPPAPPGNYNQQYPPTPPGRYAPPGGAPMPPTYGQYPMSQHPSQQYGPPAYPSQQYGPPPPSQQYGPQYNQYNQMRRTSDGAYGYMPPGPMPGGPQLVLSNQWAPSYTIEMSTLKAKIEAAFQQFDRDQNGVLDLHEFYDAFCWICYDLKMPYPTNDQIMTLIRQYDYNYDGKIDQDEFKRIVKALFGYKSDKRNF
eukprot:TRINITY_DN1825_c0_g1_i1.p1 TRINITY_DN1825_c0_g1~~TRINITY_DN1825_c0_g1_i1.p1  ORF type:complete len:470 (+),score=84.70 TRINITY_DN1825_c0_g1_i1:147-1556(+)